jgi:hypothetical protein
MIDLIGGIGTSLAQHSNAFGDQEFKRHFVPFNCFAALSIPALFRSVQKRSHESVIKTVFFQRGY